MSQKTKKKFAKHSLGQNFLKDTSIREKILDSAGEITNKNILEIGPGLGFLTTKLISQNANVTAIEIDERSCRTLEKDFGHKKNFKLIQGDILKENLEKIFEQKKYSIIANIPYNITSRLFRKILSETKNKPEYCILMVQKEVAQKITNKEKRSILSISVEIFAESEILFEVPKEAFFPIPKVDSAVIRLAIRENPLIKEKDEKIFFTVVNAGFSQKRKKLGNFLGKYFGAPSEKILGNIDPNRRAETLSIDEWKKITENAKKYIF